MPRIAIAARACGEMLGPGPVESGAASVTCQDWQPLVLNALSVSSMSTTWGLAVMALSMTLFFACGSTLFIRRQ
ncbi:Uncharacterised protein [Mycobacteroides abscessus subsp. abscessus]|nr:Uncharacterised protein [Mycobacteroides abscessus subsp. abscessus]